MGPGTRFRRFLPDDGSLVTDAKKVRPTSLLCHFSRSSRVINFHGHWLPQVRKLLLCSGKLYYELHKARAEGEHSDIAIARVEQLAPFPFDYCAEEINKYPNAEVVWVQEEPKNMGYWTYVRPRIATATRVLGKKEKQPTYVGRKPSASPAAGAGSIHEKEQLQLITKALE